MLKRFKIPLIATAIILTVTIIGGLAAITVIHYSDGSNREKAKRAELAGGGIATFGCIAIAPFWLYAAMKIGQEKRAKLKK
ncbi:MAG: hypothetical protein Aurels2KO_37140 [Aureliella sp.]